MAEAHETEKIIYQNLIDAGCDNNITKDCMLLFKRGKPTDMLPILKQYRKKLLDSIHKGQKQIDCLDYLIYKIQKEKEISL